MAEAELEAKQVAGEETEAAPKKHGGKFPKKLIMIGGAFILQAVVLFFVFDMLKGGHKAEAEGHGQAAEEEHPPVNEFATYLEKARRIDLGEVNIWDETDPSPRATRKYSADFVVWIDAEAMKEIEMATEKNPDALNRVQSALKKVVHEWMLGTGGEALKGLDMQGRAREKVKDYINDTLAPLKNRVVEVHISNFKAARY